MARRRPDPAPQPEDPTPKKSAAKSRAPIPKKTAEKPAPRPRRKSPVPKPQAASSPASPTPALSSPAPPTLTASAAPTAGSTTGALTDGSMAPTAALDAESLTAIPSPHALEARTPPPESNSSDHSGAPRAACLPRLVFLILFILGGTMTALEVRNVLRHPSVLFRNGPKDAPRLVFYQKGHASAREAFLLEEPTGPDGPPRLIQRIDCRPQFSEIGEIRWTADRQAVYAAGRTPQSRGVPVIRWLHEFAPRPKPSPKADLKTDPSDSDTDSDASSSPSETARASASATPSPAPAEGRLYISQPAFALPGRTAFVENAAALTARWKQHQGAGPIAAAWYDLGAKGDHLFSWQTTRWENALGD